MFPLDPQLSHELWIQLLVATGVDSYPLLGLSLQVSLYPRVKLCPVLNLNEQKNIIAIFEQVHPTCLLCTAQITPRLTAVVTARVTFEAVDISLCDPSVS